MSSPTMASKRQGYVFMVTSLLMYNWRNAANHIFESDELAWKCEQAVFLNLARVLILKLGSVQYYQLKKLSNNRQHQLDIMLGFGLIGTYGYIQLLCSLIFDYQPFTIIIAAVCNTTAFASYVVFLSSHFGKHILSTTPIDPETFNIFHGRFLFFVGLWFPLFGDYTPTHWVFSLHITVQLFKIRKNGISLDEGLVEVSQERREELSALRASQRVLNTQYYFPCEICEMDHRSFVILDGCGITVCDSCVESLRDADGRVVCPYCSEFERLQAHPIIVI